MAHPKTARRGFIAQANKDRQHQQRPSTPTVTKTEHLFIPKTDCTRCRSEQNRAASSVLPTPSPTCTQMSRTPPQELKQTQVMLGCERRPNVRKWNHHSPVVAENRRTEFGDARAKLATARTGYENRAQIIRNRDREEEGRW
ncbi:hypothetical protein F2Q69_00002102 [Brassica cretica]|uniref:Uncharacterized protein n=1 Tax=Brassica cretica TaxID=69181 RepID=A0A8S9P512_BRACR|nr:hypothetical protein F2Q69_00002102 [Brassica cretica]